jgi:hypothetical protein
LYFLAFSTFLDLTTEPAPENGRAKLAKSPILLSYAQPGVENSMPARKRSQVTFSKVRSALTNGSTVVLGDVDARSAWMRRLKDLIALHVSDLGGPDSVTEAELRLARKAAMLELQTEMMEKRWAEQNEGEAGPKSLDQYIRAVGSLRRVLSTLGLERRQKNITPSVAEYVRHLNEQEGADA